MFTQRLEIAVAYLKGQLINEAPYKTGNLAMNSIRVVQDGGSWQIVIGGELANYAIYTNEVWSKGTNPNQGWIERAIEKSKPMLQQIMSGSISQEEYDIEIARQKSKLDKKMNKYQKYLEKNREQILQRSVNYDI